MEWMSGIITGLLILIVSLLIHSSWPCWLVSGCCFIYLACVVGKSVLDEVAESRKAKLVAPAASEQKTAAECAPISPACDPRREAEFRSFMGMGR